MATTFEHEPAQILLSMSMNTQQNLLVRRSTKRPLEDGGDNSIDVKPDIRTTFASQSNDYTKQKKYLESTWETDQPPVQEEVEVTATQGISIDEAAAAEQSKQSSRTKEQQAHLPKQLKESLKRLKNLLKLPKARRWVYCEYFFSDIDRELLFKEQEFRECLRESFPNLKTNNLRRAEWRQVRRLIGRPRRCSRAFFDSERATLEARRELVREIHKGATLSLNDADSFVPFKIPKPLAIGAKVHARVYQPKDGVYGGTVDAAMDGRYRIIFNKDLVMPLILSDIEVMSEKPERSVPLSFYLEKNKAAQQQLLRNDTNSATSSKLIGPQSDSTSQVVIPASRDPVLTSVTRPPPAIDTSASTSAPVASVKPPGPRDDRCGNFPLRLVVMLVKLSKLLDIKKTLVAQVQEMNNESERMHLYAPDSYIKKFQERYAKTIFDLEKVNKQLENYLRGISDYIGVLLPQLSDVTVTSRPEALHKLCQSHAGQIVKNTKRSSAVRSERVVELINSLTALLLQIRALGQQQCNSFEFHSLYDTIRQIKANLDPQTQNVFEDHVEVHAKQIELTMQENGGTAHSLSSLFH